MINRARIEEKHKNLLPKNNKNEKKIFVCVCVCLFSPSQPTKIMSNYVNRNITFGFSRKKMNFDMTLMTF